jgi:tRNA(Arg) A34 adenosine deaminase TadA
MPDDPMPYVLDPSLPIAKQWDRPLSEVAGLPPLGLADEAKERHRIFSLCLFTVMRQYFNGNSHGSKGEYPWRVKQREPDGRYTGSDYLGHNIGALAVDGRGEVIDFDFNHNTIFASSVEHAETRLVRRVFGLSQIGDGWQTRKDPAPLQGYSTILSDVTVYTSLESCAQCSGVMALGEVSQVVFLQRDPGTYHVGNILYSLTKSDKRSYAPLPIPGSEIDFGYFTELNKLYADYYAQVKDRPFWIPPGGGQPDTSRALTGFLCTDDALDIYDRARADFYALSPVIEGTPGTGTSALSFPDFRPTPDALSNAEALDVAARFAVYAARAGRRGTPHK